MRKKTFFLLLFIFLLINAASASLPVLEKPWSAQGIVINDSQGDSVQRNPKVVADGEGGYLVVWEDGRSGYFDIYIQKIDKDGNLRFGKEGIAVCGESKNQLYPNLISDGSGGAIVTWQDYRTGSFDIYAQRVDGQGELLWQRGGVPVCRAEQNQFAPELVTDGKGGAIITWYDYRTGSDEDIYAQRLDSKGNFIWTANGVSIFTGLGTQWYPKLASDHQNGAIITWADSRGGNYDIYAQRVNTRGEKIWQQEGVRVCEAPGNQLQPIITNYRDLGVVIAWEDYRNSFSKIYLQFVDSGGGLVWHRDGVEAAASAYPQKMPILSSSEKEITIVWEDYRLGRPAIFSQRFNQQGKALWIASGVGASKLGISQMSPLLSNLSNGKTLVAWQGKEGETENWKIYAQIINSKGETEWGDGKLIAKGEKGQEMLAVAVSPKANKFVAVWQANKGRSFDIYAQQMSAGGNSFWGSEGLLVNASVGNVAQQNAKIINDGFDNYIVCWEDARSGYYDIYLQKVSGDADLLWEKEGIAVTSLPFSSINPRIVGDGLGGVYVVWEDFRNNNSPNVYSQHINIDGKISWEKNGIRVCNDSFLQMSPDVALSNDGGAIIVWKDSDPQTGSNDIMAQKVSASGGLEWGKGAAVVSAAAQDQNSPRVVSDDQGGTIVIWTDYRNGRRNPDIYAQRMSEKGKPLWSMDGISVCRAPGSQIEPWIIADGKGGAFMVWADAGGGNYDIYAQRIDAWGKPLWKIDGTPLVEATATQRRPRMVESGPEEVIVVWEDYRFDNWDIFAQKIDGFGTNLWGKDGKPVCQWIDTQYSPNLASDGSGGVIVTWEDYRNGRNYNIFAQSMQPDGLAKWEEGGVLVSHTPNGERNPQIASDKHGGAVIITWDDYRYGGRGIYAQKIITMRTDFTPDS